MQAFLTKTASAFVCIVSLSACTAEMKEAWESEKRAVNAYDYAGTFDKINPLLTKRKYIKLIDEKNKKQACVYGPSEDRLMMIEGLSDEINYVHCMGRTFDGAPESQRLEGR